VPVAAAGCELAACRAPEVTFVTIYWTSEFGSGSSGDWWCRLGDWCRLVTGTAANTSHRVQ